MDSNMNGKITNPFTVQKLIWLFRGVVLPIKHSIRAHNPLRQNAGPLEDVRESSEEVQSSRLQFYTIK